jgi:hypothetical protein
MFFESITIIDASFYAKVNGTIKYFRIGLYQWELFGKNINNNN